MTLLDLTVLGTYAVLLFILGVILALAWAELMVLLAGDCTCAKGRVCPSCLAASDAIRPGGA